MKVAVARQHSSKAGRNSALLLTSLLSIFLTTSAAATQILLQRGTATDQPGEYHGVVDLAIDPGFDNAKVTVTVDGQKVAEGLTAPYHVVVDLGPAPLQHRITISARGSNGKRTQWTETINRGLLPLTLRVRAIDAAAGVFEVDGTAPTDDPIETVQLWDQGHAISSATTIPARFTVPPAVLAGGFVQVTARTKAGEEAADFWSAAGNVHVAELQVRTVPIFVSVIDRDGVTHDNIDRSLFRIVDGNAEGHIIEFGKAFDQPISIALLVDSSASMTYSMKHAAKAASEFVQHALKDGDRCSVTAVQDVPRRKQPLTGDRNEVAAALAGIVPMGRTALYDAVASAIRELREEKNRRALVVLTDGSDTNSTWSYRRDREARPRSGDPDVLHRVRGWQRRRRGAQSRPPALSRHADRRLRRHRDAAEPDGEIHGDRERPARAVRDHVSGLGLRQIERVAPGAGGRELAETDGADDQGVLHAVSH
jgi:hypothetical protein